MKEIRQLKEKEINDYISSHLLNEDIDIYKIKQDLSIILGEIPGIQLEYKTENLIMEDGRPPIKKENLESINIYYTYEEDVNGKIEYRFGTLTYLTD